MPDVFLSYSRDDQATARRFAEALQRAGFNVWWDQSLTPGEAFDQVTEKALDSAKAVVVLWSRKSVDSRWVRAEATQAHANHRLVPAMIEPCRRPIMFELTQSADLSQWDGNPDDPQWQAFLVGIRRLVGDAVDGSAATRAPELITPPRPAPSHVFGVRAIAIGLAVVMLVGGGYWLLVRGHGAQIASNAAPSAIVPATQASLAVLPFANLSSDPEQEHFVDGLTEEVINSLANLGGLQVTGRTSSFQFKGHGEDMKAIGEKLGVEYLLEGTVRRSGERLRITAQLIKASDGFHLWSQPYDYDRPMADLIAFQEDISRKVAEALQITLGVGALGRIPGMTRNVEAYRLWLEGNALVSKSDYDQAADRYDSALALDPSFALAWATLGESAAAAGIYAGKPLDSRVVEARKQIVLLVPDSALNHRGQASLAMERYAWQEAEEHLRRARAAATPSQDAWLVGLESIFLATVDQGARVQELAMRAYQHDPLNPTVVMNLARSYISHSGEYDRARELMREARMLDPKVDVSEANFRIALQQGDRAAMKAGFGAFIENNSRFDDLQIHEAVRRLFDQPEKARAMLRGLLPRANGFPEFANILFWSSYFGDTDLALEALRKISTINPGRGRGMARLLWWNDAGMRSVRTSPGFKTMLREMNLVDYWRKSGWGEHCRPLGDDDFECT